MWKILIHSLLPWTQGCRYLQRSMCSQITRMIIWRLEVKHGNWCQQASYYVFSCFSFWFRTLTLVALLVLMMLVSLPLLSWQYPVKLAYQHSVVIITPLQAFMELGRLSSLVFFLLPPIPLGDLHFRGMEFDGCCCSLLIWKQLFRVLAWPLLFCIRRLKLEVLTIVALLMSSEPTNPCRLSYYQR